MAANERNDGSSPDGIDPILWVVAPMSRSQFVKPKPLTRRDGLREQIAQLEALVGQLGHGLGEEALSIPPLLDQITAGMAALQATGQSTPGETSRLESTSAELQRKATLFLREVGGARVLRSARSAHQPDSAHWWWHLDRVIADRRWAQLRRWLVSGVVVALLLALLFFIYERFLAPDPAAMATLRRQQAAESLAQKGDWNGALSEVEQALMALPDDPDGLVLKGIIQQELGQSAAAETTFAAAEARLGSREQFLILRAAQFIKLDQNEAALADAQEAISLQEDSATGYLMLGQANFNLEHYAEAIAAFQQASDLAEKQGNPELSASARIRLGMAMQMIAAPTITEP